MKKILLLGGSFQQIIAIKTAKNMGIYTVLCDYLIDNPGQYIADKFYLVSTTDKDKILEIAKIENIDGIVAYASDPAAPTAAYVAEKLNLPTNPYKSIETLANKDLFRKFLLKHKFNVPKAKGYVNLDKAIEDIKNNYFTYPFLIKPVDSSGSKGITKVTDSREINDALNYAMNSSRNKKIIIEEYIEKKHEYIIGGDCFVINGKVELWGLLNCHRDLSVNPLVPVGKSYPLMVDAEQEQLIHSTVEKLFKLLNIEFGAFNLEMIFDSNNKLYLIEVGPRNGGNMIPNLLNLIFNIDIVEATIACAMGDKDYIFTLDNRKKFFATHNLHTDKNGRLENILFDDKLEENIINKIFYKNFGEKVEYFNSANKALGIIFMKFDNFDEMREKLRNINKLINIVVSEGD